MFVVPSKQELVERMVLRQLGKQIKLTDLTTISVWRIIMEECLGEEFLALWMGLAREQDQWFITTARAENLDRRLADYGLSRPQGTRATGVVTATSVGISGTGSTTLNPGAAIRTNPEDGTEPKRYTLDYNPSDPNGRWPTVVGTELPVTAVAIGPAGNTPSGTVTTFEAARVSCTNPQPFTNGRGVYNDDEFRQFFRDYLVSLTRGTRESILRGILNYIDPVTNTHPVASAAMVEWGGETLLDGTAHPIAARVYIESGSGSANPGLVLAIQNLVDGDDTEGSGLRGAGVPIEVVSAVPHPVDVDVLVTVDRQTNPSIAGGQVEDVIKSFIGGLPVAGARITGELQGQLNFSFLFRAVMDVTGILRAQFQTPTDDWPIPTGRKAVPAGITVRTEMV